MYKGLWIRRSNRFNFSVIVFPFKRCSDWRHHFRPIWKVFTYQKLGIKSVNGFLTQTVFGHGHAFATNMQKRTTWEAKSFSPGKCIIDISTQLEIQGNLWIMQFLGQGKNCIFSHSYILFTNQAPGKISKLHFYRAWLVDFLFC